MDDRVTVASSRIERWQLRPGDHIYAWRRSVACAYPHHGIYESDKKVIHFRHPLKPSVGLGEVAAKATVASFSATVATAAATVVGGPIGGAATAAFIMGRAADAKGYVFCSGCRQAMRWGGVVSCCLNCFLEGDNLCLFAYSVPPFSVIPILLGGIGNRARLTGHTDAEDPPETVLRRANDLLDRNGFGSYDPLYNNCFDFAFYCKTLNRIGSASDDRKCVIM